MTLKGKTVLVTGGSKGIGRAYVEAFAEQGANMVINYFHDDKAANEVAASITKYGVKALVVQGDIASQSDVDAMFTK